MIDQGIDVNWAQFLASPGGIDNFWLLLTTSLLGCLILSLVMRTNEYFGVFTNFMAMFVSAMLSNRFFGKFDLGIDKELGEPFVMYLLGMTICSLILLRFSSKSQRP